MYVSGSVSLSHHWCPIIIIFCRCNKRSMYRLTEWTDGQIPVPSFEYFLPNGQIRWTDTCTIREGIRSEIKIQPLVWLLVVWLYDWNDFEQSDARRFFLTRPSAAGYVWYSWDPPGFVRILFCFETDHVSTSDPRLNVRSWGSFIVVFTFSHWIWHGVQWDDTAGLKEVYIRLRVEQASEEVYELIWYTTLISNLALVACSVGSVHSV